MKEKEKLSIRHDEIFFRRNNFLFFLKLTFCLTKWLCTLALSCWLYNCPTNIIYCSLIKHKCHVGRMADGWDGLIIEMMWFLCSLRRRGENCDGCGKFRNFSRLMVSELEWQFVGDMILWLGGAGVCTARVFVAWSRTKILIYFVWDFSCSWVKFLVRLWSTV